MSAVTVEEVSGGKALTRFIELPHALHGADPRFAPLVLTWERYRMDPRRNPFFERGDGRYFLARRLGRPVGRITAHLAEPGGEGRFGFWWLDDDLAVADALLDAAQGWLSEQGCTSMLGPLSFTAAEEQGVQVAGFEAAGVTGRPWHPPHLAEHLRTAGFEEVERRPTWRLPCTPDPAGGTRAATAEATAAAARADRPGQAGRHADARIVLPEIAAVPDLSPGLRGAGLRTAWSSVQRARARRWTTCTVVRCEQEELDAHLGRLRSAAAAAGYEWLIAPSGPPDAAPETEHATFRRSW